MSASSESRIVQLLDAGVPFCVATAMVSHDIAGVVPGQKWLILADGSVEGPALPGALAGAVHKAAAAQLSREEISVIRLTPDGTALAPRRGIRDADIDPAHVEIFLEPMLPLARVIIVGAGHIAVPLARFAKITGFEVTVIDDRERFASRERFPDADEIVVKDFRQAIAAQTLSASTYLVLVTRGHEHDEATLQQVVGSPAPYIGMIGSRRRVLVVFQRLARLGVPEEFIKRIYAPIGLDIGGRTPEEIALAIMAEIVCVRRGGRAQSLATRPTGAGK